MLVRASAAVILIFFAIDFALSQQQDAPRVWTKSGRIRGRYLISAQGKKYAAFEGIPYAMPPIGPRRFEPPVSVQPWANELSANRTRDVCLQHRRDKNKWGSYLQGSEDCLYLDVYVPPPNNNSKKNGSMPVIFYIHGEAFQYGATTQMGAKYLADYGVILVTIKYRLGVLGFLSTEDDVLPGNMGLKDQSMALRWVSENIADFGGDPKKITLAGLSAGGASVHYHYLSPMSRGLFHAGMSFSGTAFDCWTQTENSREKAFRVADLVNCPNHEPQEMMRCMKSLRAESLVGVEPNFMPWQLYPFTPFGPVAERNSKRPFIDRSPVEIINSGDVQDVPWITGVVSEEGLYQVAELVNKPAVLKELDQQWLSIAPHFLDYYFTIPKHMHSAVAQVVRENYFGNKTIGNATLPQLIRMSGDRFFNVDAQRAAKAQAAANKSPVWFFHYSYRANTSMSDRTTNSTKNYGVCHGDDICMVLDNPFIVPKTPSDIAMSKDLLKMWVTVARTGAPNFGPKWTTVNPFKNAFNFLEISGPSKHKMKSDSNFAQVQFWDRIDFDENRVIIKPYGPRNAGSSIFFTGNAVLTLVCFLGIYSFKFM
ncbi:venom carboxylesterase-6-like [Trichogramma pretiosum]|uniref:venom carboxylesterase-6-like n=1 Tax=Trichogramma pretiosum TaxID=7493 RepID=UPI0006C9DBCB|nr:venom carboxylesterase-6-like [Trichogramma pretiosum]